MAITIAPGALPENPGKPVYRPRTDVSPGGSNAPASLAPRLGWRFGANRRGIIPHWEVPRAFENPSKALSELGIETYKEAVRDYYATIREFGVEQAKHTYSKWVVRRCLRDFETEMRKFQRHWHERGLKNGGWEVNRAANRGLLISPEELYESSRMLIDIQAVLKRWQVAPELRENTERTLRLKLKTLWEMKP